MYIVGGSDNGVLYGVYDFLKVNFGYEQYYKDCFDIDTGVTDLPLKNYNITDIPDISMRARAGVLFNTTEETDDVMYAYRMRMLDDHNNVYLPIYESLDNTSPSSRLHNSFYYLPQSQYKAAHPKFYSDDGTQLCYTAHGDAAELETMINLCAEKAEFSLKDYPADRFFNMNTIHLGINDVRSFCDCSYCQAEAKAHNNSNAAVVIKFLNRMGAKVVEWMNKAENTAYKRDIEFSFFVYQVTSIPPFTINADGTINVADDLKSPAGVKIRPYTAFSEINYSAATTDEVNREEMDKIEAWSKYVKDGWSWTYGCFFNEYFCFYDSYSFYADYYKKLYECGYRYTFAQFHSEQRGAETGFYSLQDYLNSELTWNSSLDRNEIIDNYFDNMYGVAAKEMKSFYNQCKTWFKNVSAAEGWDGYSINARMTKDWFDYSTIKGFFDTLDKAYAEIEVYKTTDEVKYNKIKSHIDAEWLFPARVVLGFYKEEFAADYTEMKTKFTTLCNSFKMVKIGESDSLADFLNSL